MTDLLDPELAALLEKTAVVGLAYFDIDGTPLQRRTLAGQVVRVSAKDGITLRQQDQQEFTLPTSLAPWFLAPEGRYSADDGAQISNPDYLVTWNIHRCQDTDKPEGEHQWWEWHPNTTAPSVG